MRFDSEDTEPVSGTLVHYNLPHDMSIPAGWRLFTMDYLPIPPISDELNPYQPDIPRMVIIEKV